MASKTWKCMHVKLDESILDILNMCAFFKGIIIYWYIRMHVYYGVAVEGPHLR